jgi:hypothetical protein
VPSPVYVETSIISYLTGRLTRNVIVTAHQQLTRRWWNSRRHRYELFISQLVLQEAGEGNPNMANQRLVTVRNLPVLAVTQEAVGLAERLMQFRSLPAKARVDALHIGIAAVHGMEYLLTWNCRHIANARMRTRIETVCRESGYEPPIMCTPEELMGD